MSKIVDSGPYLRNQSDTPKLEVHPRFRDVIPPLKEDEYNRLKEDIKANGCRDPIRVWDGTIIDGHNRYKICGELGVSFKTDEITFENDTLALLWIIDNQLTRRNLDPYQVFELLKERVKIKGSQGFRKDLLDEALENPNVKEELRTSHRILCEVKPRNREQEPEVLEAKAMGISHDTYSRCKYIDEHGSDEQKAELRQGTETINSVYTDLKKEEVKAKISFPDGKFHVIYGKPFVYDEECIYHTSVQPVSDICNLPVKDAIYDNATIYLETPSRKFTDALKIVKSWGFTYERVVKVVKECNDYLLTIGGAKGIARLREDVNEIPLDLSKLAIFCLPKRENNWTTYNPKNKGE